MKSFFSLLKKLVPTLGFLFLICVVVSIGILGQAGLLPWFTKLEIIFFALTAFSLLVYFIRSKLVKSRVFKCLEGLKEYYGKLGFSPHILFDSYESIPESLTVGFIINKRSVQQANKPDLNLSSANHSRKNTQNHFLKLKNDLQTIGQEKIKYIGLGNIEEKQMFIQAAMFARKTIHSLTKANSSFPLLQSAIYAPEAYAVFAFMNKKFENFDYERFYFFYRNNLSPLTYIKTFDFSLEALESYKDLPDSWIQEALLGKNSSVA